jgi:Protein ChrB, N-terminal
MVKEIEGVIKEVQSFQGTASAFTSRDLDPAQGERLRSKFLDARKEEYSELQGQYDKFVVHVEHARSTQRFTFAEVEELEEEIAKLERWLREIGERDVFKSPENARTAESLEQGRMLLQRFTEDTFAASSDSRLATSPDPRGAGAGT